MFHVDFARKFSFYRYNFFFNGIHKHSARDLIAKLYTAENWNAANDVLP